MIGSLRNYAHFPMSIGVWDITHRIMNNNKRALIANVDMHSAYRVISINQRVISITRVFVTLSGYLCVR